MRVEIAIVLLITLHTLKQLLQSSSLFKSIKFLVAAVMDYLFARTYVYLIFHATSMKSNCLCNLIGLNEIDQLI